MLLEMENVQFSYSGAPVLTNFSWSLNKGNSAVWTGPSGCGKSTLALLLAGHLTLGRGEIRLGGEKISRPVRRIQLIPQGDDLFPWKTVSGHLHFAQKISGAPASDEILDAFELASLRKRYPHELSGGQKRRVAIVRALTLQPKLIILDETLSQVESGLRKKIWSLITERYACQAIAITHDSGFLEYAGDCPVLDFTKVAHQPR